MGDFTMGLAQMITDNAPRQKNEPNESVKLYTLIKDYAQHKYNADENTVMKLYIGTKRSAKITDNAALIAYVDGKMKPEPEQPEQTVDELESVRARLGDSVTVERHNDKIKVTVADSGIEPEIVGKMKSDGYIYSTRRGLSYFFVKK